MEKYLIYGAAEIGARAEQRLRENYGEHILGYIDTYKSGMFNSYEIYPLEQCERDVNIVVAVLTPDNAMIISRLLRKNGFQKIYWFCDLHFGKKQSSFLEAECFKIPDWDENILVHGEFHVADNCNLNCRGCTHFSPLYDSLGASFEERLSDLKEIRRIFSDVFRLDILGGEPLLNPELTRYINEIRRLFPKSFINIYSNGVLIPRLGASELEEIAKNNVVFSISEYEPTHRMIDKITEKLDDAGIGYKIVPYNKKQVFNRPISTNEDSKYPRLCISKGCVTIANGAIAKCPTLMYVHKFNETFGENLPTTGILRLVDCTNAAETIKELNKPVPLCNHCVENGMEWSICDREKQFEDFATRD